MGIEVKHILCIGAGYVGGPTMAVIADKAPSIKVTVFDLDKRRIDKWNDKDFQLPIYEPGLEDVVRRCRGRNLFFIYDKKEADEAMRSAEIIFISVNTPTKVHGVGKGSAPDLKWVEQCARGIAQTVTSGHKIVVEKSTVPVKCCEAIEKVLAANTIAGGATYDVLSNPEFLAEGTAIADLNCPDRVLIGGNSHVARQALVNVYKNWVPEERIITTNLWSSELSKLVANAMLAQRISSINSVSAICEATGADVTEVAHAVGRDTRIGAKFLRASVGFGGSCFQKDVLNLVYLCNSFGLKEVADYWYSVVAMNDLQRQRFSDNIVKTMFSTVTGKTIAIWGFAFKKDTGDTRESSSIFVTRALLEDGAIVRVYDPKVPREQIIEDLKYVADGNAHVLNAIEHNLHIVSSAEEAAKNAHGIAVLTEWDEFGNPELYKRVFPSMVKPAFLFDGRLMVQDFKNSLCEMGYEVHIIGQKRLSATVQ